MKYLLLPIHLLKFWYVESLVFFTRTWKNLILYIEEDLAVTLMFKLLFVPLFHDSSIVGKFLSLIFRISRILMGLFAFALATIILIAVALFWLTIPFLIIFRIFTPLPLMILFSGVGLFLIHILTHPHKKVWQIHEKDNFWDASELLKKNISVTKLLSTYEVTDLLNYLETTPEKFSNFSYPEDLAEVGKSAFEMAKKSGGQYISAKHFFVAFLKKVPDIENILLQMNLNLADFDNVLLYLEKKINLWRVVWIWDSDFAVHHLKGVNRGWLGAPTPNLDLVSLDLTKMAAKDGFSEFVGRGSVVNEVVHILSEDSKKNVVIVGPAGSGKTTLVNFLAKQIISGDAPSAISTKRVVSLDLTKLLSGVTAQGQLAEKIKNIFEEVKFVQNIIIVVEEIQNLGMGEVGSSLNIYSLIMPYLESSDFQFIATTEELDYTKTLEKNAAFARLFTKVELPPASIDETIEVLENKAISIERKKKISVSFLAIKKIVELSQKYLHDKVLPDSALSILDEAKSEDKTTWITTKIVELSVSHRINVPVMEIDNAKKQELLDLEDQIHQRLIDQVPAVKAVADSLRRSSAGLKDNKRPIGSFLFVGPTGVGKTELAKVLSEIYFKNSGAFIRFDMSEYQNTESVDRLIGASGHEGQLTESIRNKPYALLLLDEFEKADPKILTLFLQVLEDGRLTDGTGKLVDFTNTIIIATSNGASLTIAHGLEQGRTLEELKTQVNDELLTIFKPELINRFDEIVLFKLLSQEDLQKIVKLKLVGLKSKLKEQGYIVEFDEKLISELAKKGFDPVLGARPLRRLIQDTLEAKLSRMILGNQLIKGQIFKGGVSLLV